MREIKAVLFDPVGALAEFPAEEFDEISARLFNAPSEAAAAGSAAYWHLLDLIEMSATPLTAADRELAERYEIQAVERVEVYEDVTPALTELRSMGISLVIASSLSDSAVTLFTDRFSLRDFFAGVWSRDNATGVKAVPLARAIKGGGWQPPQVMALVDTLAGVTAAKAVGTNAILMINDYDEGRRLAMASPTGGIVS